jgi:LysR family transcriptional regulator (chromosome initiation inhibitor)
MRFQVDQLLTLTTLIEEGTFEAAAVRLRVTASAVSQRVKTMEQATGQVLVRRTNPVVATPAGDIVLRYARQVRLLEADVARELVRGTGAGNSLSLPVAVNADSLATWFLEAIAALPDTIDAVFDIHREDQDLTTSLLRSGTVMAAVTSTAEAVQGCVTENLGIMRYRAVCSPGFVRRWLGGEARVDRLATVPVVNFDRKDDLQHRFLRRLTGRTPHPPRHYIPTSSDFARAVALGFGWALLPEQQCLDEIRDGRLVELAANDPIDVRLYWQRWNLASPLLDEFSAAVRGAAAASLHPM